MSHDPLSPRLRALVEQERASLPAEDARRARVFEAVQAALPPLPPPPPSPPPGDVGSAGGAAATQASLAVAKGKLVGILALTFAAGAGAGAGGHAVLSTRAPAVASAVVAPALSAAGAATPATPSVAPSSRATEALPATPSAPSAPRPAASASHAPSAPPAASSAPSPASGLTEEQALIDVARAGVARGHADAALEAIGRHERQFPRGRLTEEREGLRVLALVRAGRTAEAQAAAARFRRIFPSSVMRIAIDRALPPP